MNQNSLIDKYNAKSHTNAPQMIAAQQNDVPVEWGKVNTWGKLLKLHNLLADNQLQYLYPLLEKRSMSIEGLVKLSRDYDFVTVMKKLCKVKQRDAVRLMTVIIKYISAEYQSGRQIQDDPDIVKTMENRSKK